MGHRILKQPNGKLCLYSTIVDTIIEGDLSQEDILEIWVESVRGLYKQQIEHIVTKLDKGENPYGDRGHNYRATLDRIRYTHGKEEFNKVLELTSNTGKEK